MATRLWCLTPLSGSEYDDCTDYQLLIRAINEQTVREKDGSYRLREKGEGMNSENMHNPADPDATFRSKAGNQRRGYVANDIEESGENGSIITEYQYEKNTHSDSEFAKETIELFAFSN